jgi:hypothetical protein
LFFLLSLGKADVYLDVQNRIVIGINDFVVGISNQCSGVDSLLLFSSLYFIISALDWKKMRKKPLIYFFIFGLIGAFLMNILRVYLLMLVGAYISPTFALHAFHTNIGWILFIIYFVIYWYCVSKYVYTT